MQVLVKWFKIWWLQYRMRGLQRRAKDLSAEMAGLSGEIWLVEAEITRLRLDL